MTDWRNRRIDLFHWLALAMTPGVGPRRFANLLKHFSDPAAVFKTRPHDLAGFNLPDETIQALTCFDWGHKVEGEIKAATRQGYRLLMSIEDDYPGLLKNIDDPPPVLWVAGELKPEEDQAAVAIVGSRGATEHGRAVAARIAGELSAAVVTVISGMAVGIDAAAHRGAISAGGRTIGVLGCGLDIDYPKPNLDLLADVPKSGALVTEFPLGSWPQAGNFPRRNRIISGLSLAVVVVEAAEKSGALITARFALDQGRDVMAVPGRAGSIKSAGTHAMIKQGAALVETGQDIINELETQLQGGKIKRRSAQSSRPLLDGLPDEPETPDLSPEENKIWTILDDDPLHVDVLSRKTGRTPPQLAAVLLEMELKGLVKMLPGQLYTKVK
ncbi:MAG: DNA-protecting protein DprA [Deltaproteobacteria bacterium]|nr:DNA-protecting protein DprA [Deltaproteobacteria bacterium]